MKFLEHVLNGKIASFTENRKPYSSDGSDEEWAFIALYLILFPLDAGQRKYSLREVFNAVALCGALLLPMAYAAKIIFCRVIGLSTNATLAKSRLL